MAQRFGDLSQDPYVRPGDTITVNRADRVVAISGEVERPGDYQLLPGDTLTGLIGYYAHGYTPLADSSRIELIRHVASARDSGDKIYLSDAEVRGGYALEHLDAVYIPAIGDLMPVMFVEGAIGQNAGAGLNVSNRVAVQYNEGENYASLIQRNRTWFSAISDTRNAFIQRGERRIAVNLNPMLYDSSYRSEYVVAENDTLVIPFRQYFVTVAGAVARPGNYPYIPERTWEYYIAMAGGLDPNRNSFKVVTIRDIEGKRLRKEDIITPETIITAETNAALYYFNQYAPVIMTTLSLISTFVSVYLLLQNRIN
jgi:protein involved in polysaccharide export with SLBB domain